MSLLKQYSLTQVTVIACLSLILAACGGGGSGTPDAPPPVIIPADTTPNTFSFDAIENAERNTQVSSNQISINGIDSATNISISGGEYSINGGYFSSSESTINNNDTITLRVMTSADFATQVSVTLNIGGVSGSFSVTTKELPPPTNTTLNVYFNNTYSINGVSSFERSKYITLHASHTENDWFNVGENESDDLITDFVETYDVYFGRDTGGMAWQLGLLPEDPNRLGFIDKAAASNEAGNVRWSYNNGPSPRRDKQIQHEDRNRDMIVAAQLHPYWPDGAVTRSGWSFSTEDSLQTPFGTATGEYMGTFLAEYFNRGQADSLGQPKPVYVEVINEPLYELVSTATNPESITKIFEFHNTVAKQIRQTTFQGSLVNQDLKIGGYTAAFPDFEKDNFQRWRKRDQHFIDIAGENMDFLSIHLYDFPIFGSQQMYRSGANAEATFDMLETYSNIRLGHTLPFVISEYGAQTHNLNNSPWSPRKDWLNMRSTNTLLFSFINRPHLIDKTIPFIPVKAEWGRRSETVPYPTRLMRQKFEAAGESGEQWVYSEQVKFYDLWKNVNGERLYSTSSDLDIQHAVYVDGSNAYIVINNLELESDVIDINIVDLNPAMITTVNVRHLYAINDAPILSEQIHGNIPQSIEIGAFGTAVIEVELSQSLLPENNTSNKKYYSGDYLQAITANSTLQFDINNVDLSPQGQGILRLSLGRDHNLSLSPVLSFNAHTLAINPDYRGIEQNQGASGRASFYGTLEIPVPNEWIESENVIKLSFPDSGGYVASITFEYISNVPSQ